MAIQPSSITLPVGTVLLPFQTQPGTDSDFVQHRVLTAADTTAPVWERAEQLAGQITWRERQGKPFPSGHLVVNDAKPSRTQRPAVDERLGSLTPVTNAGSPEELVDAWERFLTAYRTAVAELAAEAEAKRAATRDAAQGERDAYEREMRAWAQAHGSLRLRGALAAGVNSVRLYRSERRDAEFPGLFIDADNSTTVATVDAPSSELLAAHAAVHNYAAERFDPPMAIDMVRVSGIPAGIRAEFELDEDFAGPTRFDAVRVSGWLGRHTLFGFVTPEDGVRYQGPASYEIDAHYPPTFLPDRDSVLRPTRYASAYGVTHQAAQDALRTAVEIVGDEMKQAARNMDSGELDPADSDYAELWPGEVKELLSARVMRNLATTVALVGWKLGQRQRQPLSSIAECLAFEAIIEEGESLLHMAGDENELVDKETIAAAITTVRELRERLLLDSGGDELEAFMDDMEELSYVQPATIEPAWLRLWAPLHDTAGDSPPSITGGHERSWLNSPEGLSAAEQIARWDEDERVELPSGPWQIPDDAFEPMTHSRPDGTVVTLRVPHAPWGRTAVEAGWNARQYPNQTAFEQDDRTERQEYKPWAEVFATLPAALHPTLVDRVVAVIDGAVALAGERMRFADGAGPMDALMDASRMTGGAYALRRALERAREDAIIRDPRLSRFGVKHRHWADWDAARFIATVRFELADGADIDVVTGAFNGDLFRYSMHPLALALEPDSDGSVLVRIGLVVEEVTDAADLARRVIDSIVTHQHDLIPVDTDPDEGDDEDDEPGTATFRIEPVGDV